MNKTLYLFAGALLAVGASSCSSDEPGAPDVAQKDETRYLRFNIMNPTGSRAAEFEIGTETENAVNNMIMDFYDKDGTFVYRATPKDMTWKDNTGTPTPSIGRIGSVVVSVGIEKNKKMPAYVMCYLNPVEWSTTSQTISMAELRNQTRPAYSTTTGGKEYFAMNNSCYYGDDPLTKSNDKVKISGTPIDGDLIYPSLSDAEDADNAAIDIYVERYAAKVKFNLIRTAGSGDGDNASGIFDYNGNTRVDGVDKTYSLKFVPEYWTINADAPTMYAVKKFQTVKDGPVATFDDVNAYLGSWSSWNDEGNHRSYWSCSPAFFATEFPQVTDDVIEKYNGLSSDKKVQGNTTGAGIAVYDLKYYSYNQIKNNGNTLTGDLTDAQKVRYALENTVGSSITSILNPKAAVPTLLIAGNYKATYNGATIADNTSFYIYDNGLYFKDAVPTGVSDGVTIYDKFLSVQTILAADNTGAELTKDNLPANVTLAVQHPNKNARDKKYGENLVTLQITNAGSGLYYKSEGNTYSQVTPENINTVNTLLLNQCGTAYSYTQGKCYFAVPIHHLRWSEDNTDKPITPEGALDWAKIRVGDMGLVRNHVYNLEVKAIKGLATGIDNLDNPIVAPIEQNLYWIKYQINILNWRIVPTQGNIIL